MIDFDHIELSCMDIRGYGKRVLADVDLLIEYMERKPPQVHLFQDQMEGLQRSIRGAIRRSGKPKGLPVSDWVIWMENDLPSYPVTWNGLPLQVAANRFKSKAAA